MARIFVGISGWNYAPWRGNFYPKGLPQNKELAFASRRFTALEVNGTFYSLQRPSTFSAWYEQSPEGFVFALKGSRFITHMLRLKDVKTPLANFMASGPLALREKLGPILWQFPPQMKFDADRFRRFFDLIPFDTDAAARLARKHDGRLKGRAFVEADRRREIRHAVEFRHESFLTPAFTSLLREYNVALVAADVAGKFPTAHDVTADWVYVRLHGSRKLYASGYSPREIRAWAQRVEAWHHGHEPEDARLIATQHPTNRKDGSARPGHTRSAGRPHGTPTERDVFVFFDNTDVKLRAPVDARRMADELGVGVPGTPAQVLKELGIRDPRTARTRSARSPRAKRRRLVPA